MYAAGAGKREVKDRGAAAPRAVWPRPPSAQCRARSRAAVHTAAACQVGLIFGPVRFFGSCVAYMGCWLRVFGMDRSYHGEHAPSHQHWEAKHHWARLVVRWGTTCETRVLICTHHFARWRPAALAPAPAPGGGQLLGPAQQHCQPKTNNAATTPGLGVCIGGGEPAWAGHPARTLPPAAACTHRCEAGLPGRDSQAYICMCACAKHAACYCSGMHTKTRGTHPHRLMPPPPPPAAQPGRCAPRQSAALHGIWQRSTSERHACPTWVCAPC